MGSVCLSPCLQQAASVEQFLVAPRFHPGSTAAAPNSLAKILSAFFQRDGANDPWFSLSTSRAIGRQCTGSRSVVRYQRVWNRSRDQECWGSSATGQCHRTTPTTILFEPAKQEPTTTTHGKARGRKAARKPVRTARETYRKQNRFADSLTGITGANWRANPLQTLPNHHREPGKLSRIASSRRFPISGGQRTNQTRRARNSNRSSNQNENALRAADFH